VCCVKLARSAKLLSNLSQSNRVVICCKQSLGYIYHRIKMSKTTSKTASKTASKTVSKTKKNDRKSQTVILGVPYREGSTDIRSHIGQCTRRRFREVLSWLYCLKDRNSITDFYICFSHSLSHSLSFSLSFSLVRFSV
jgi:hypothetical protein